jgi:phosphoribosylformimino-5-aminoimidazole carboxamide ribotide isomerase
LISNGRTEIGAAVTFAAPDSERGGTVLAVPSIDLRAGACVQLASGALDRERIRIKDPTSVLDRWEHAGFRRIHVVDLDAALGVGENADIIDELLSAAAQPVQVGGGVRTGERVEWLLASGADQVIVGRRGLQDMDWLAALTSRYPGRLIVGADVHDRRVAADGSADAFAIDIADVVEQLAFLPLGGLLVTAVQSRGRMSGPDVALMEQVVDRAAWPVIASGGVGSVKDLRRLEAAGVAETVIGMALYTGALNARAVADEFWE